MKTPLRYRVFILALTGLCAFVLVACSNTKKDGETYQSAKAVPSLEVPPDLINPPKDSTTAIPNLPPANKTPAVQAPAGAAPPAASPAVAAVTVASAEPGIHIVKEGERRWLVVTAPVEEVRQRVKEFLLKEGFTIAAEVPDAGIVETEWRGGGEELAGDDLNAALKSGLRDKFKLLVESGAATGTSEVSVSHLGLQRIMVDGKPQWQPRMSDPVLEAQILDELRVFLQNRAAAAAPANDRPAVKSSISTDAQGLSSLTLSENFDRAWQRVGDALPRGGFVIDDRNRSEGVYMIRLGKAFKEDAKEGFIARLFGSNAGNADDKYRIAVKQQGSETSVTVQQAGGGPVFTGIGERILDRIKEKMQ